MGTDTVSHICDETGVKQVPVPVFGLERDVGLAGPVGVHRHTANGRR